MDVRLGVSKQYSMDALPLCWRVTSMNLYHSSKKGKTRVLPMK